PRRLAASRPIPTRPSSELRLLTVDGTSLSLSEQWFGSEYLPDPLLWPRRPGTDSGAGAPTPTSVGAASCLESDMLSWRRIPLPRDRKSTRLNSSHVKISYA